MEGGDLPDTKGIEYAEKVLSAISLLYDDSDPESSRASSRGLAALAAELGVPILKPRRKVTVLLLGNHSAGKSSFVNWYIQHDAQATGVAVESKGFTVITHGKRHDAAIGGAGTLKSFPHLHGLERFEGVMDHLETKVSAHRSRDFRMIDFVDTPGLVDGNVEYPFDVNGVLQLLAGVADLVLVFVDPMGQALCSRTMQAVHALERRNASKMRYFLSKVDTIGDLNDLLKVSNQMTQNLSKYVHNTHGFHVDPVFIPGAADDVDPAIARVNRIEALCDELGRAVHQKVQNNMALAAEHVDAVLRAAQLHVSRGQRRDSVRAYLGIFRVLLLALLLSPLALLSAHHLLPLVFDDDPNVALVTGAIDTALGFGAALVVHPLAPGVDGARRGLIAWVILALLYVVADKVSSFLRPKPGRETPHMLALRDRANHIHRQRDGASRRRPASLLYHYFHFVAAAELYERFFSDALHVGEGEQSGEE